jgi:hypothetical protein
MRYEFLRVMTCSSDNFFVRSINARLSWLRSRNDGSGRLAGTFARSRMACRFV